MANTLSRLTELAIPNMLFLGAGASKAFGIGDLADVTVTATNIIRNRGFGGLLDHIYDTLIQDPNQGHYKSETDVDIEVILSVLDLITAPESNPAAVGVSTHYIYTLAQLTGSTYQGTVPTRDEYRMIRTDVEKNIADSCNQCNFHLANQLYSRLFSLDSSLVTTSLVNALNEHPRELLFKHIVTTNYDLVLERYDLNGVQPPKHCMRRAFTRGGYEWNEPYLDVDNSEYKLDNIQYLKLHGSTDWWIRSRDNKIVARESPISLLGESYLGRQMIYPAYDKHVSEEPYSYLFNYFRKILNSQDVYIVVGFSFRDPSINNAFRDVLLRRPESRMIIVNRTPNNIRNNISNFPHDKIDVIAKSFEDDELIDELRETLMRPPSGGDTGAQG